MGHGATKEKQAPSALPVAHQEDHLPCRPLSATEGEGEEQDAITIAIYAEYPTTANGRRGGALYQMYTVQRHQVISAATKMVSPLNAQKSQTEHPLGNTPDNSRCLNSSTNTEDVGVEEDRSTTESGTCPTPLSATYPRGRTNSRDSTWEAATSCSFLSSNVETNVSQSDIYFRKPGALHQQRRIHARTPSTPRSGTSGGGRPPPVPHRPDKMRSPRKTTDANDQPLHNHATAIPSPPLATVPSAASSSESKKARKKRDVRPISNPLLGKYDTSMLSPVKTLCIADEDEETGNCRVVYSASATSMPAATASTNTPNASLVTRDSVNGSTVTQESRALPQEGVVEKALRDVFARRHERLEVQDGGAAGAGAVASLDGSINSDHSHTIALVDSTNNLTIDTQSSMNEPPPLTALSTQQYNSNDHALQQILLLRKLESHQNSRQKHRQERRLQEQQQRLVYNKDSRRASTGSSLPWDDENSTIVSFPTDNILFSLPALSEMASERTALLFATDNSPTYGGSNSMNQKKEAQALPSKWRANSPTSLPAASTIKRSSENPVNNNTVNTLPKPPTNVNTTAPKYSMDSFLGWEEDKEKAAAAALLATLPWTDYRSLRDFKNERVEQAKKDFSISPNTFRWVASPPWENLEE